MCKASTLGEYLLTKPNSPAGIAREQVLSSRRTAHKPTYAYCLAGLISGMIYLDLVLEAKALDPAPSPKCKSPKNGNGEPVTMILSQTASLRINACSKFRQGANRP